MRKIYDAVCSSKYKDKQGNEKTRYTSVGAVFEGDKGMSLKLESLPINFSGWISFYEPKERQRKEPEDQFDSDIGF
jgi:hypothetical protein